MPRSLTKRAVWEVIQTEALSPADIVDAASEALRHPVLAHICQQYSGLHRRHLFQKILECLVENDRLPGRRFLRRHDACLVQTDPVFEPGFDYRALRRDFEYRIIVEYGTLGEVSAASPMDVGGMRQPVSATVPMYTNLTASGSSCALIARIIFTKEPKLMSMPRRGTCPLPGR